MNRINRLRMQIEPKEYQYVSIVEEIEGGRLYAITSKWDGVPGSAERVEGVYASETALRQAFPGDHVIIIDFGKDEPPDVLEVGSVAEQT